MSKINLSEVPADKPLNIICHPGNVRVVNDRADVLEIGPEQTVRTASFIEPDDWQYLLGQPAFMDLFRCVFCAEDFPDATLAATDLGDHDLGIRHIVGLILMAQEARHSMKTPFVRLPESYLHPRQQVGLGDLFIRLSK